jgi:hypothetical protein
LSSVLTIERASAFVRREGFPILEKIELGAFIRRCRRALAVGEQRGEIELGVALGDDGVGQAWETETGDVFVGAVVEDRAFWAELVDEIMIEAFDFVVWLGALSQRGQQRKKREAFDEWEVFGGIFPVGELGQAVAGTEDQAFAADGAGGGGRGVVGVLAMAAPVEPVAREYDGVFFGAGEAGGGRGLTADGGEKIGVGENVTLGDIEEAAFPGEFWEGVGVGVGQQGVAVEL